MQLMNPPNHMGHYYILSKEYKWIQMDRYIRNILCDIISMYIWTCIRFRDISLHTMWQLCMCIYGHSSDSEALLSTPCDNYLCGYINIRFRDISLCIHGQTFASFIFSFQICLKLLCFIYVYNLMPTPLPITFFKLFWSFRVEG